MKTRNILPLMLVLVSCPDSGGVAFVPLDSEDISLSEDITLPDFLEASVEATVELPEGMICVPGHSQCIGSNFMTCNSSGTDWTVITCAKGTTCTPSGCRETTCSPNTSKCDENGMVVTCKPDGTSWSAPVPCGQDQVCKGGKCLNKACPDGEVSCTQNSILTCKDGAWVETPCKENEVCFKGECIECFVDSHCPVGLSCVAGHCKTPPLLVKTTELPDGQVGTSYEATLEATGGDGSYTWAATTLPDGLKLDNKGYITGKPTTPGTTDITFTVTDGTGASASKDLSIVIHGQGLTITSKSPLPAGEEGTEYSYQFKAIGGLEPYGWMVLKGALPAGLTLSSSGLLSGIPNDHGTFPFTIRVVDAGDPIASAKGDFELTIKIAPLEIIGDQVINLFVTKAVILPLITVVEGIPIPYNQQLKAKGGVKPYHWAEVPMPSFISAFIPKAGIPNGLTLSDSGQLSGAVTKTDSVVELKIPFTNYTLKGFFFMAKVTDSQNPPDSDQAIFLIPTVPVDFGGFGL